MLPRGRSHKTGFGFRVSVFGFRVSVFGFRDSGFGLRVSVFGFRVSGLGFRVSGFGSRFSGLDFRVSDLGFRFSGLVFSGLGFRISVFGFRVAGLEPPVHAPHPPRPVGRRAAPSAPGARPPGNGNSNSHGARPVHLIITMIERIRTSRSSALGARPPIGLRVSGFGFWVSGFGFEFPGFFFFFTPVTGPRRSLSLKLSDTRVYEPQIRAHLGTTAHLCKVFLN